MDGREEEVIDPGSFANYCGQRWKVGAVGWDGVERYYWLVRLGVVLMAPATMVKPWSKHVAPAKD